MNSEIDIFYKSINESWNSFISHLPNVLFSLVVMMLGLLTIKMIHNYVTKFVIYKSNYPLIAYCILSIISLRLTIILFVICLGVLDFDDVTNKIIAAAGLTTFILGFALKDIDANFLAGILMVFQRPFRIGNLIQIDNIKRPIIEMNLRSSTIKTLDGIDASILKNNLENFTIDALMRSQLIIGIELMKQKLLEIN